MKNNKCEGIISIRTALMPRGGSEKVFQTEFFHLIEQLDLGDKAGVGGGVFAPFLTADFSEVHLFDPRYNKTPLTQYIAENDIDQVLVLYSVANFVTDSNLFVLSK